MMMQNMLHCGQWYWWYWCSSSVEFIASWALGVSGLPVTFRFSSFSRPWQSGSTSKWHVRTCSYLKWSSWNWHCLEIAPTCANRQFSIFTIRVWVLDRKQLHKKVLLWTQVWLSGWDTVCCIKCSNGAVKQYMRTSPYTKFQWFSHCFVYWLIQWVLANKSFFFVGKEKLPVLVTRNHYLIGLGLVKIKDTSAIY